MIRFKKKGYGCKINIVNIIKVELLLKLHVCTPDEESLIQYM